MSIASSKVANQRSKIEGGDLSDEIQWTDDKIRWSDDEERPPKTTLPENSGDTTIELQGYQAEADEIWKSTGLTLWRASDFLCAYLLEQPQLLLFRNKTNETSEIPCSTTSSTNVLELGAGLGLVGLLADRILATETNTNSQSRVVLTDGDTDALAQLRANLRRNQDDSLLHVQHHDQTHSQHRIECHQLLWGHETAIKFRNATTTSFDVILASDIVYAASIVEPLWETIEVLLSKPATSATATATNPSNDGDTITESTGTTTYNSAPCFVLAIAKRRVPVTIETVLEAAVAHGFAYELVKQDPTGIWIYVFQWQQKTCDP